MVFWRVWITCLNRNIYISTANLYINYIDVTDPVPHSLTGRLANSAISPLFENKKMIQIKKYIVLCIMMHCFKFEYVMMKEESYSVYIFYSIYFQFYICKHFFLFSHFYLSGPSQFRGTAVSSYFHSSFSLISSPCGGI